jgi:DNA repair exonuclease SbcCD ATPase subunit
LEEEVNTKSESLAESLLKVGTLAATVDSLTEERDIAHSEKVKNLENDLLRKEEEYKSTVESLKAQVASLSKTQQDVGEQPASSSGGFEDVDISGDKRGGSGDDKDRVKALEEELSLKEEQLSNKEEELEDYELTVGSLKAQLAALSSQTPHSKAAEEESTALKQDLEKQNRENDLEVAALKARVGELEAELQFMTLANEETSAEKAKPVKEESAPEESSLCVNAKEMEEEKEKMLAELIKQKTQLQEENSFLIGELTEAKIELAEMKMR